MLSTLHGAQGFIGMKRGQAVPPVDWWLASGTIALGNVKQYVENLTVRTVKNWSGGIGTTWTISFRTNLVTLPSVWSYAFDCYAYNTRVIITYTSTNGFNNKSYYYNIGLFIPGDHTYMLVSNGSTNTMQAYRDAVAISGPKNASYTHIERTSAWGGLYDRDTGAWPVPIKAGHIANIQLNETQRGALHASMMALT